MSDSRPLGDFLRSRRHRLDPAKLGIACANRRRTPGLRREEVAARAGISSEWYVKLEQGREVAASAETISALARALLLDDDEAAHLRKLAAHDDPPHFAVETVPEAIRLVVLGLSEPAYVTGARWDVLCWNEASDRLLGFSNMSPADRNILLYMMTTSAAREIFGDGWAEEAERMVALFRPTYDRYRGNPLFEEMLDALNAACPEFAGWWASYRVATPSSGHKTLRIDGREGASFVYSTFQANDDPALKLALYARLGRDDIREPVGPRR